MSEENVWTTLPVIDQDVLGPLCEVLEESAFEVLDEFLSDTPRIAQGIQSALAQSDFPTVSGLAHQLKSSSGALGGVQVQTLSSQVEKLAKSGQPEDSRELCQHLFTAIDNLLNELTAFRGRLSQ